ncbi:MAG: hypothetical protein J2P15_17610, partial [Micromonosporaceae bacterium]|nr:hypothetical protein [Micromonosporaceae bacterium]
PRRPVSRRRAALPSPVHPYRWAVLVAAAVVAALLLAAAPPARAAIDRILRLAGIEFSTGSGPPGTLPGGPDSTRPDSARPESARPESPAPLPTQQVSLAQARAQAAFPIAIPTRLGQPDRVALLDLQLGRPRVVILVWHPGTPQEIQLDEYRDHGQPYFSKQLMEQTDAQLVPVGPDLGAWVPVLHVFTYIDVNGVARSDTTRLAGPVLAWQRADGRIYRLEGVADLDQARAIAASLP